MTESFKLHHEVTLCVSLLAPFSECASKQILFAGHIIFLLECFSIKALFNDTSENNLPTSYWLPPSFEELGERYFLLEFLNFMPFQISQVQADEGFSLKFGSIPVVGLFSRESARSNLCSHKDAPANQSLAHLEMSHKFHALIRDLPMSVRPLGE